MVGELGEFFVNYIRGCFNNRIHEHGILEQKMIL